MLNAITKNMASIFSKDNPEMEQNKDAVVLDAATLSTDLATAQAALTEKTTELSNLTEQLAKLTADHTDLQTALVAANEAKEQLVATAEQARMTARKDRIVAAVGTDKADALMEATQGLADAAFDSVVGALAGSVKAEAETDLFVEKGVTAEVDASVVTGAPEMALIKNKFNVK